MYRIVTSESRYVSNRDSPNCVVHISGIYKLQNLTLALELIMYQIAFHKIPSFQPPTRFWKRDFAALTTKMADGVWLELTTWLNWLHSGTFITDYNWLDIKIAYTLFRCKLTVRLYIRIVIIIISCKFKHGHLIWYVHAIHTLIHSLTLSQVVYMYTGTCLHQSTLSTDRTVKPWRHQYSLFIVSFLVPSELYWIFSFVLEYPLFQVTQYRCAVHSQLHTWYSQHHQPVKTSPINQW